MYGTNPHGQGTVAGVGLSPSTTVPYPYNENGQPDALVLGRGRSEQLGDGSYHSHITVLSILGIAPIGIDATPGNPNHSPLAALQTLLDNVCTGTGHLACVTIAKADATATSSGATTAFELAHASLIGAAVPAVNVGVASSNSSISTTGNCQNASGNSQAANVGLAGVALANVAKSSESSTACQGQTPTQTASSSVIGLGGAGVGIPAPGCANGTPNTQTGLLPLLNIICNANDTTQLPVPAGVREALTVLALQLGNTALAKVVAAASESHAVAPNNNNNCTDADMDCGKGETCNSNGVDPDGDADCTGGNNGNKCKDTDKDCKNGQTGQSGTCSIDQQDSDGDCDNSSCPDSDMDCGRIPPGGHGCPNDTEDKDGDCVLPNGGSETGSLSGTNAGNGNGNGNGNGANAGTRTVGAGLPFTGQDVLKVLLIGLLLAGGGLALGYRTRKQ
jgi:hypothetical protein